jgi:hypothetical protein
MLAALALLAAGVAGLRLYWTKLVDRAYGRTIVVQSLAYFEVGRAQVVAIVTGDGVMPGAREAEGFERIDRRVGPPDRNVRIQAEMKPGGAIVIRYDGWKLSGAQLTMAPRIVQNALVWECQPVNIPREWIDDACFQIGQQSLPLGFDPTAPVTPRPVQSEPPEEPSRAWAAPFVSRAALSGDAAAIAEGLHRLLPYQNYAEEYFRTHDRALPSGAAEMEARFPESLRRFPVDGSEVVVTFGPGATMFLQMRGVTLMIDPSGLLDSDRLEWTCRPTSDEQAAIELPPECAQE